MHAHDLLSFKSFMAEKFRMEVTYTISSCTIFDIAEGHAFALSQVVEVLITDSMAIDVHTLSMLPRMSDLHVADPRVSIQGTLLIWLVKVLYVVPASIVVALCLNTNISKVCEV